MNQTGCPNLESCSPLSLWIGILATLSLAIAGCSGVKVKQPTSDTTPPALIWNVFSHGNGDQTDHPGSPTLPAKRGDAYRVTLKANDPEGVKSIQLNPSVGEGEISWQCKDPPGGENLSQNKSATLGPMTQNLSPDANGMVLTSIFLIWELDLALACPPGWTYQSGSAKLTGRASNYFGGVATEVIKFNVSP